MTEATSRWAGLRLVLTQRNYRLFVSGQLVSLIGTFTQSVAQSWLVYRLTGSGFWLGAASFCQQVPAFFFASFGGVVADRHRRRTVLVFTQTSAMTFAFALAALTLTGHVRVRYVLALAALLGTANAVDSPTRQSFVPEMVGRENLATAVALNTTMVMAAGFVGPAIGGVAVKLLGEGWCFLANGVSFLAVIAGLLAMRDLPPPTRAPARESMVARLHEGFRFAATHVEVRALLMLLAVTMSAGMPYATLMPIFASTILHGDSGTLGVLMGAPGLGAVLVGLVLASRRGIRSYRFMAGAVGLFGVLLVLFSQARTLGTAIAVLIPMGMGMMVQLTATNTLIQTLTPDALRGRVMAIWFMIFMGFAPVGALLAGTISTAVGPCPVMAGGGALCALGAMVFARWSWNRPPVRDPHAAPVTEGRTAAAPPGSREEPPRGALETRR